MHTEELRLVVIGRPNCYPRKLHMLRADPQLAVGTLEVVGATNQLASIAMSLHASLDHCSYLVCRVHLQLLRQSNCCIDP